MVLECLLRELSGDKVGKAFSTDVALHASQPISLQPSLGITLQQPPAWSHSSYYPVATATAEAGRGEITLLTSTLLSPLKSDHSPPLSVVRMKSRSLAANLCRSHFNKH